MANLMIFFQITGMLKLNQQHWQILDYILLNF